MSISKPTLYAWMSEALNRLSPHRPAHLHLDQLGVSAPTKGTALRLATTAYELVLDHLGDRAREVKALLFLPLHSSENLNLSPPPLNQLSAQSGEEPPSIYLLSRRADTFLYVREEYRVPYALNIPVADRADVFTWYRVHRDEESYRQGWEYSRSIVLEHYPADFQFTQRN
jgi:hypothetical protein